MDNQNLPDMFNKAYEPRELRVLDIALTRLCDSNSTEEERRRAQRALLKLTQSEVPSVDDLVAQATDLLTKGECENP